MKKLQTGFSIIEAMISATILGFGLIAVTKMQSNARFATDLSRQRNEAVTLASSKIEMLRSGAACVNDTSTLDSTTNTQASTTYTMTWTCNPATKLVKVIVTWNDSRGTQAKSAAADGSATVDNRVELNTSL
jgi:type IV pilus assembly protein PilV